MSRRVAVCTLDSLPEGSFRVVAVDGHEILLARLNNDIYAVDAVCTHESGPLGEGYLEGDAIVCPIHFTMFSLRTGQILEGPATRPLQTYPVHIEADTVLVTLPSA
jgi:3-phenylpropionate/trans-cinnamate dioxygenase ferredoxin subunit